MFIFSTPVKVNNKSPVAPQIKPEQPDFDMSSGTVYRPAVTHCWGMNLKYQAGSINEVILLILHVKPLPVYFLATCLL